MLTRWEASALKKILPQRLLQIASKPGLHILQVRHKLQHISTSTNRYEEIWTNINSISMKNGSRVKMIQEISTCWNSHKFPIGMPKDVRSQRCAFNEACWSWSSWTSLEILLLKKHLQRSKAKGSRSRWIDETWWNCIPNSCSWWVCNVKAALILVTYSDYIMLQAK